MKLTLNKIVPKLISIPLCLSFFALMGYTLFFKHNYDGFSIIVSRFFGISHLTEMYSIFSLTAIMVIICYFIDGYLVSNYRNYSLVTFRNYVIIFSIKMITFLLWYVFLFMLMKELLKGFNVTDFKIIIDLFETLEYSSKAKQIEAANMWLVLGLFPTVVVFSGLSFKKIDNANINSVFEIGIIITIKQKFAQHLGTINKFKVFVMPTVLAFVLFALVIYFFEHSFDSYSLNLALLFYISSLWFFYLYLVPNLLSEPKEKDNSQSEKQCFAYYVVFIFMAFTNGLLIAINLIDKLVKLVF